MKREVAPGAMLSFYSLKIKVHKQSANTLGRRNLRVFPDQARFTHLLDQRFCVGQICVIRKDQRFTSHPIRYPFLVADWMLAKKALNLRDNSEKLVAL